MKQFHFVLWALCLMTFLSCGNPSPKTWVGQRTDALDPAAWEESAWISVADAPVMAHVRGSDRAADGACWFVSETENPRAVRQVRWMSAGLGVYTLYVNGKPVGEEFLKPGFTHAQKTKRSFTYDITDAFLKKAGEKNVLSAQVTPGWWADKIVNGYGKKPAFRSVLEIVYKDGSVERLGTDCDHWKAGIAGPVTHAAIFDGEAYDARILPGYATPEKLGVPEIYQAFQGEILPSEGAEVYLREDLALQPVKAYVWEGVSGAVESEDREEAAYGTVVVKREYAPGQVMELNPGETLVVDFGQNAAAVPCFRFKAAEGTVLTCLPGELLNDGNGARKRNMDGPEGSVHRNNLRMADGMVLQYTFADTPDFVCYYPECTFFGYRLISVTATAPVQIAAVQSIPVSSITKALETGTITTGSPEINQLISNAFWGQLSNYLSVPTDCPQRNERLGWTADTQVFTETGTFFANTDAFFLKWMRDMRDSQSETGAFPGVAPTAQYGNNMMRLGWADAGIIVPWTIWKQFGDVRIVEENWEAMDRFMRHIDETRYDHNALSAENGNYQWADWLSCEALESCINLAFDSNRKPLPDAIDYWCFLGASYWALDASMMADMAQASGRDAQPYRQMADNARAYLKETFLDEEGCFKTAVLNTMQTPALFALRNKLVEGVAKEKMAARLRGNFALHGNCLQTGFLGTSILMGTLTANGMADIAWDLLFQNKYPSWLYSIENGATTIWERWNSYTKEKGLGPQGMNSFNHYAYGSVCQWIWETAAGIAADPADPGFRHIIMSPVPDKRLGSLDASFQSAAGLIKSSWKYEDKFWIWNFTIPKGATATVTLPGETQSKEYAAGSYTIKKEIVLPVMSYNVRYGNANDGDFSWPLRREAACAMINAQRPAIFGVQEALDFQLDYIQENCPGYLCVGVGREDGVHGGEHMSVFYDSRRIEMQDWGTYWLSETPDQPSKGWDAACKRTATWTLVKDKVTDRFFYFVNTHLDHVGVEARRNGLLLLVERIGAMNPERYPMILTGDMNVSPDDPCLTELRTLMDDARQTAPETDNATTYHGYGTVDKEPIDFIFHKGFAACDKFEAIRQPYLGVPYVSDHYPIQALFRFR